jgi:hypothetical protein
MPKDIRAGCIRFDSATQVEGGWASIEGAESVRFDAISDLDSDCVFITNLGFNESYKTGLSSSAKVRTTDYLDTPFYSINDREESNKIQNQTVPRLKKAPKDMIAQLGVEDNDWERQVEVGAQIAKRVFEQAKEGFDIHTPPFFELKRGIRDAMIGFDPVIKDMKLFDALESSTTHFSLVQRSIDAIQIDVDYGIGVTVPKATHALNILSKPLPAIGTNWKFIGQKVTADKVGAFLDSLNPHGIYLFRVNIKSFDEEYANIVNFGTGKEKRVWITGVEAQFYRNIAKFEIYQGFEAEEIIDCAPGYEDISSFYNSEKHDLSYSAGLFLQNIWTGLAKSKAPPANIVKSNESFNVFAPFLKAYDRLALIEVAKKLTEHDVVVTSYSKAELRIVLKNTQLNTSAFEIFKKADVLPYGLKINMDDYPIESNVNDLLRKIYMEGDTDSILALDQKFYMPEEMRKLRHVG